MKAFQYNYVSITEGSYRGASYNPHMLMELWLGKDTNWDMFWAWVGNAPADGVISVLGDFLHAEFPISSRPDEDGYQWQSDDQSHVSAWNFFHQIYKNLHRVRPAYTALYS